VYKGTKQPIDLKIELDGLTSAGTAQIQTLSANVPWAANTLEAPTAIVPVTGTRGISGHELSLRLAPYSYTLVRVPKR
jgi:alpha-L-arabinofuranosidase